MFKGITTAVLTPFKENSQIDFSSLEKILNFHAKSQVDFLLVGGSTGEGSNLSKEEYLNLVKTSLNIVNGKKPLLINISSANYQYSLELVKTFNHTSIYGFLSTAPYYSIPSQKGIFYYFTEIDQLSKKPIMIYNHPRRTSVEIGDDLLISLSKLSNIFAIKDSSADYEKPMRIGNILSKSHNKKMEFISGDDGSFMNYHFFGGEGVVSVLSNLFPETICYIWQMLTQNNYSEAKLEYLKILPLLDMMKLETNPVVIKYMAYLQGLINTDHVRPALLALDENSKILVKNTVQQFVNADYEADFTK